MPRFRHSGEEAAPSESSSLGCSSYQADGNESGGPLTSVSKKSLKHGPATWAQDGSWGDRTPTYMLNRIIRSQAELEIIASYSTGPRTGKTPRCAQCVRTTRLERIC